jgi:hypothetical protein
MLGGGLPRAGVNTRGRPALPAYQASGSACRVLRSRRPRSADLASGVHRMGLDPRPPACVTQARWPIRWQLRPGSSGSDRRCTTWTPSAGTVPATASQQPLQPERPLAADPGMQQPRGTPPPRPLLLPRLTRPAVRTEEQASAAQRLRVLH